MRRGKVRFLPNWSGTYDSAGSRTWDKGAGAVSQETFFGPQFGLKIRGADPRAPSLDPPGPSALPPSYKRLEEGKPIKRGSCDKHPKIRLECQTVPKCKIITALKFCRGLSFGRNDPPMAGPFYAPPNFWKKTYLPLFQWKRYPVFPLQLDHFSVCL